MLRDEKPTLLLLIIIYSSWIYSHFLLQISRRHRAPPPCRWRPREKSGVLAARPGRPASLGGSASAAGVAPRCGFNLSTLMSSSRSLTCTRNTLLPRCSTRKGPSYCDCSGQPRPGAEYTHTRQLPAYPRALLPPPHMICFVEE
jgi:hypothetical protein